MNATTLARYRKAVAGFVVVATTDTAALVALPQLPDRYRVWGYAALGVLHLIGVPLGIAVSPKNAPADAAVASVAADVADIANQWHAIVNAVQNAPAPVAPAPEAAPQG